MSIGLLALVLVVATGLASAGFDLYQKLLARVLEPVPMVFLLGLASTPLFAVLVALEGWPEVRSGYWMPALGSTLLNLWGHVAFVQAVRISPLSLTVPLLSLTPVFTALLAIPILGEWPGRAGAVGVVLVVAGAFWLHAGPAADGARRWWRVLGRPGAWLMASTAFAWSLSIPLDKLAIRHAAPTFHGLLLTAGITLGAGLMLVPEGLGRVRNIDWRRQGRDFTIALLLCTAALAFQLLALTMTLVSIVETAKRGIANLMALAFGRWVFREPIGSRELGAATVMALGVALILA